MFWAGLPLMAVAATLGLSGIGQAGSDFQRHALPFWLFVAGLVLAVVGAWSRERQRDGATGPAMTAAIPATAPATAAARAVTETGGLSRLQRPSMNPAAAMIPTVSPAIIAPGAAATQPEMMERIRAFETDNARLRAFLLDAKASIAR
jgi:hypothetical protein